ncbi:Do family serine endopeptidase [Labrys sp. ZIDIC5]|uniref:Do family serine endopeptidase n=1 Tax=Labrys sedimenti TaxID=3106036 RepID=UPI002ACABC69|nr:Do family serine endopeptidase [Labrys sp. ZIDIC5]MDZ5449983.1 Do family serine endopeptidase [Labrys sp. ZIDIC5]
MNSSDHDMKPKAGILARRRTRLMAAVFGLGVAGAVAGNFVVMPSVTPAFAQTQSQAVQSGVAQPGFADIVQKVRPAVVSIKVKTETNASASDDDNDGAPANPFEFFFNGPGGGNMQPGRPRKQFGMALGSGFFISADGYVVTNNHVVDHAKEVDVVTDGGKTYTAKVIGVDPKTDLALLKVQDDAGKFPFVELELQNEPRVGDWVLAVGNPYGLGGTVTAGIVSARGRDLNNSTYNDFLQIDAPVNRGNSGGPTFDLSGRVIGVNTAIYSPSGGSIGIGFAIPAETVSRVVSQLKADGQVTRGYIGVQIQPVTQDIADSIGLKKASGALIADVTKNGPAAKAGLQSGDAITAVNGKEVSDSRELARAIADVKPGETADLTVWRDGKEQSVKVETSKLPGDKQLADARSQQDDDTGGKSSLASLGVELAPAAAVAGAGKAGVVVTDVDPGSPAAESLRPGDVILDIAGKPVSNVREVREILSSAKADSKRTVLLRVKNNDGLHFVALPIGKA